MKSPNPLSIWGLTGVLLASAITFYLLVPSQRRLLNRLIEDGKAKRALSVLQSIPQSELARDPVFYGSMRLRLERQLLDPNSEAGVTSQIEAALKALEASPSSQELLTEVIHAVALRNDGARALQLVGPHLKTLPDAARRSLIGLLVRNALASSQPEVAAAIHEHCLQPFPSTETNLVEAVRLWRAAARVDQGLRVLEDFERQSGQPSSRLGSDLMEVKFGLLRELGRTSEAFELAAILADRTTAVELRQKWLKLMQATAGSPAQHRKLLEEYLRVAQANPVDVAAWRLIAEMSITANDLRMATVALQKIINLTPGDIAARKQLAQLYEWSGAPSRAFDLYLKLAEQNDASALERLIALNPGLYRDRDVLRLLRGLSGAAQPEKYRLLLARLLTKHGEYADAYSRYREHLQQKPDDVDVMKEYAQTLQRQQVYESALVVWKSVQKLKPEDDSVLASIAEVCSLLGDFEGSLQAHRQLAKRSTDLETIRKYCTLAESLGDFQSLKEALGRAIELKKPGAPEDFIKLAYVLNLLGAVTERRRVLERGLKQFPDNDTLRIKLSILWMERRESGLALQILAQSRNLKTDLDTLRLYLDLLVGRGDFAAAEKFLRSGLNERILEAPSIASLQALIYEETQNDLIAEKFHEKLYRQHPGEVSFALNYGRILARLGKAKEARAVLQPLLKDPTLEILREAAHVYAESGDYKMAEELQARVVELPGQARLTDWSYLGDIRYSAGNRSAARRTYRQALALAELNLHSQSP